MFSVYSVSLIFRITLVSTRLFICILFSLLTQKSTNAQIILPKEYTQCAVLIDINNGESFGSGILYQTYNSLYVVTAKHVIDPYLKDDLKMKIPLTGQVKLSTYFGYNGRTDSTTKVNIGFSINKFDQEGRVKKHPSRDIAIIKIASGDSSSAPIYASDLVFYNDVSNLSPLLFGENLTQDFDSTFATRDVYVFGYPKTIGLDSQPQYDFDLPLVQKGIISAKDNVKYNYIVNCPVYGGNSGGPVILVLPNGRKDNLKLIGLVTEYIPYINRQSTLESNSGYSIVIPFDFAKELMIYLDNVSLRNHKKRIQEPIYVTKSKQKAKTKKK